MKQSLSPMMFLFSSSLTSFMWTSSCPKRLLLNTFAAGKFSSSEVYFSLKSGLNLSKSTTKFYPDLIAPTIFDLTDSSAAGTSFIFITSTAISSLLKEQRLALAWYPKKVAHCPTLSKRMMYRPSHFSNTLESCWSGMLSYSPPGPSQSFYCVNLVPRASAPQACGCASIS